MNLVYIGLNPQTPEWLSDKHHIKGVADLGSYLLFFSLWPPDIAYQTAYRMQRLGLNTVARVIYSLSSFMYPWCSPLLVRYHPFVKYVIRRNAWILDIEERNVFEAYIKKNSIDIAVINAWSILPNEIVNAPRLGTVNIHPSKLPAYRGALPTLWVLKNKEAETAVTFIQTGSQVDSGKIISQYLIPVSSSEDALSLELKIDEVVRKNLSTDLEKFAMGELHPMPQTGIPSTTAKYNEYREIRFAEERIQDIKNKVMLYPYLEPGVFCFAKLKGKKIYFQGASEVTESLRPGDFCVKRRDLIVGTKDGTLAFRLFRDIGFVESCRFLALHTQGSFDD